MPDESPTGSPTGVLVPPTAGPPRPGFYQAAERSILEISALLGPLATLRGRVAVLENTLDVADSEGHATLALEAGVPSLRTTRPVAGRRLLGRKGLDAHRNSLLRLRIERISTLAGAHRQVPARLFVRASWVDIAMNVRIAVAAEDRIALLATGTMSNRTFREACSVRLPRSVPADRVRFLLAADFR